MSVVFHVKLLNILGFVHLPEKVLDKYFEIKGVLNLITCSMGFYIAFNIKKLILGDTMQFYLSLVIELRS
jgi:hypothetical protein